MSSSTFDWAALMIPWNAETLNSADFADSIPADARAAGWLGFAGATADELTSTEERLGTHLPPSYRQFLAFSNGWRCPDQFIPRLWNTEEIEWLAVTDPGLVDIWTEDPVPMSDDEYLAYREDGGTDGTRGEYLQSALRISDQEEAGTAILVLNPEIVTPDGEWEAWFFAHWIPGASRFRSFWDLMVDRRKIARYLERGR